MRVTWRRYTAYKRTLHTHTATGGRSMAGRRKVTARSDVQASLTEDTTRVVSRWTGRSIAAATALRSVASVSCCIRAAAESLLETISK